MPKKKTAKKLTSTEQIEIGVGLTAAAVAAAGAYFLYGSKNAAKNRTTVKSWALKAKAEVLEKMEDAKEMTESEYEELITAIAGTYSGVKSATKGDIKEFKSEMMEHWDSIQKFAAPKKKAAKKAVKQAKKSVKKATKKTATKAKKVTKKVAKKAAKKK
jgi:hypothetical protein